MPLLSVPALKKSLQVVGGYVALAIVPAAALGVLIGGPLAVPACLGIMCGFSGLVASSLVGSNITQNDHITRRVTAAVCGAASLAAMVAGIGTMSKNERQDRPALSAVAARAFQPVIAAEQAAHRAVLPAVQTTQMNKKG